MSIGIPLISRVRNPTGTNLGKRGLPCLTQPDPRKDRDVASLGRTGTWGLNSSRILYPLSLFLSVADFIHSYSRLQAVPGFNLHPFLTRKKERHFSQTPVWKSQGKAQSALTWVMFPTHGANHWPEEWGQLPSRPLAARCKVGKFSSSKIRKCCFQKKERMMVRNK